MVCSSALAEDARVTLLEASTDLREQVDQKSFESCSSHEQSGSSSKAPAMKQALRIERHGGRPIP